MKKQAMAMVSALVLCTSMVGLPVSANGETEFTDDVGIVLDGIPMKECLYTDNYEFQSEPALEYEFHYDGTNLTITGRLNKRFVANGKYNISDEMAVKTGYYDYEQEFSSDQYLIEDVYVRDMQERYTKEKTKEHTEYLFMDRVFPSIDAARKEADKLFQIQKNSVKVCGDMASTKEISHYSLKADPYQRHDELGQVHYYSEYGCTASYEVIENSYTFDSDYYDADDIHTYYAGTFMLMNGKQGAAVLFNGKDMALDKTAVKSATSYIDTEYENEEAGEAELKKVQNQTKNYYAVFDLAGETDFSKDDALFTITVKEYKQTQFALNGYKYSFDDGAFTRTRMKTGMTQYDGVSGLMDTHLSVDSEHPAETNIRNLKKQVLLQTGDFVKNGILYNIFVYPDFTRIEMSASQTLTFTKPVSFDLPISEKMGQSNKTGCAVNSALSLDITQDNEVTLSPLAEKFVAGKGTPLATFIIPKEDNCFFGMSYDAVPVSQTRILTFHPAEETKGYNNPLAEQTTEPETQPTTEDMTETTEEPTAEVTTEPSAFVAGDATGDGIVDIMDVIHANKFILGIGKLNNEQNADVDASGQIDSSDTLNILKIVLNMLSAEDIQKLRSR